MTEKAKDNAFFSGSKTRPVEVDAEMLEQGLVRMRDGTSVTPDFIGGVDPDLLPDEEERRVKSFPFSTNSLQ